MRTTAITTNLTIALTIAIAACSAERPHGDMTPDAGSETDELAAPNLADIPISTSLDTIAIRGNTGGASIVVTGASGDPVVRSVLPSGAFCADVPLNATGETSLLVFALKNGVISQGVRVNVTKDASAPIPADPRCLGMEQPYCVSEDNSAGNCTNGSDDNCNGFSDECESGCNGCVEDGFGPNASPFLVPMVAKGTYQLSICPCHSDYFAFTVAQGQTVHVRASFNTSELDLDMRLQVPQAAQDMTTSSVASSVGTTGTEEITWAATAAGTYYLHIYPFQNNQSGSYQLTIF